MTTRRTAQVVLRGGSTSAVKGVITIRTYQDFQAAVQKGRLLQFMRDAIQEHRNSDAYKIALDADAYDAQRNVTINETVKTIYGMTGAVTSDDTASNHHIASNFFHRLNIERATYSLGNGVTFDTDGIKEKLGPKFDTDLFSAGKLALRHGVTFGFWNSDRLHVFPLTEFVALYDETDNALRAGIRYWSIDWQRKPIYAVLYEEDGYTKYQSKGGKSGLTLEEMEPKRAYKQTVSHTEAGGDEVIGEENYSRLPIVPLYGNEYHQSTLVGMQAAIDAYDLIMSGFANTIADTAEVYWLIGNALGMTTTGSGESDDPNDAGKPSKALRRYMENLRRYHVAVADTDNSTITPYTQEVPYAPREAFLSDIKRQIYSDFCTIDPDLVAAGNLTATQIRLAYDAQDKAADAFEYQVIEFVQQILSLMGLSGTPQFKRNRVANQQEEVNMIVSEAEYLDDETILDLLPNVTPDMKAGILERKAVQDARRWDEQGGAVEQDNNGGYRYVE